MASRPMALEGVELGLADRSFSPRQEEVLDTLERIFFSEGLDVTVGELAERAKCSRRTLYDLAPTKEALFFLVFDRMRRRLSRAGRRAAAKASDPEHQIEAFVAAGLEVFQPASPAFVAAIESFPPARLLFDFHLSQTREFLVEKIELGIAEGRFRPLHPELVAEALMAAVRRVIDPEVLETNGVGATEALDELFGLVLHGLLAPK